MANLILHSDDLGLHVEVNRGIFAAAEAGALTSASLMLNGAAVEHAVEGAANCPSLALGIHLNIVRGRPLSDPDRVPSLVDRQRRFFNSVLPLAWRSQCGRLSTSEIYHEYRLQLRRMLEYGIEPSHIDAEKHTHLLIPEATRAIGRLRDEFGLTKVRSINEVGLNRELAAKGIRLRGRSAQRVKLALLEHRSRQAREVFKGWKTPEASFGVLLSGGRLESVGLETLRAFFALESPRTVEWMFHLGYDFDFEEPEFRDQFGSFFLKEARAMEVEFLVSPAVRREIEANPGKLISYAAL